jgi:betaine-aldehyde dehydrogenase
LIGGEWVSPAKGRTMPVIDPATGKPIARVAAATKEDVDRAVDAARAAFVTWKKTSGAERATFLEAIADRLMADQQLFAEAEVRNNGKPLADAMVDVSDTADTFRYYAKLARELDENRIEPLPLMNQALKADTRKQPIGVAGAIIPWNYPLMMAAWKVAPALAAGCTMVLKPSELTPITALMLGKVAQEAGLPPGVLNIINGTGKEAGQALASSPKIDKLAFTGGTETGRKIALAAAENIIPAGLELGGKSPLIIMSDADIDKALPWVRFGIFGNQGEVCSATSRVIVHESIKDEFLRRLVEQTKQLKVGNGMEPGNKIGPLISEPHLMKVMGAIETAKAERATLVCGGNRLHPESGGFYLEPTIFTDVTPDMAIFQKEIFGPVLAVTTFKDEEEAIRLANDSMFGLAASVFSRDPATLERVADQIDAGVVWKNCSQPVAADGPPWGGMKKSGIGRELGHWGLNNYLQTKSVAEYVSPDPLDW